MGRVTTISVDGLDLWFNSSDHLPPHFHARKPGHWEVRVYLLETTSEDLAYEPKWPPNVALPSKTLRTLRDLVAANRAALVEEWEQKVRVQEEL
jgi:hypothetical protein